MNKKNFLVEIGTEELPFKANALRKIAEKFTKSIRNGLKDALVSHENIKWFASPRRIAITIDQLDPIKKVIDLQNNPNEYKILLSTILTKIVETALIKLSDQNSMSMRWGTSNLTFIRPIHTITLLLGEELIPAKILGISSSKTILGHRFMGDIKFDIDSADQYAQLLITKGKVIADYELRKNKIRNEIQLAALKIGGKVYFNEIMLEEATSLVEWPVILTSSFDEEFLDIPSIILYTIQINQHYFPIYDKKGKLLPKFILVTNLESRDPQNIINGNQRFLHTKLVDARYFFNIDRKKTLEDYLPDLEQVIYQDKLGTLRDKTNRLQKLIYLICVKINICPNLAIRAGLLAKCDLVTKMVFEFPTLQGIVGMHYALLDGEDEQVASALKEQYFPSYQVEKVPSNIIGCILAIADKIDHLTGIIGIGKLPESDRDPFALRRNALSLLRIIIEKKIFLDLNWLIEESVNLYNQKLNNNVVNDVINFIMGRYRNWYLKQGYSIDIIQSVLVCRPTCPIDFHARMEAISSISKISENYSTIIILNKRITNILKKSKDKLTPQINFSFLREHEEIELANAINIITKKIQQYVIEFEYPKALLELVKISNLINNFFKKVQINTSEKEIRINRLTILNKIKSLFIMIADFSLLH
ncbi:MAG: glycine--tRNA ligase subunit beta [Candidatus Dasytiphilus stammeri]